MLWRRFLSSSARVVAQAKRSSRFASLTDQDVLRLRGLLGDTPGAVVTEKEELLAFNSDWMGRYRGSSELVLKPSTSEEVAAVLQYCNQRRLAVVPQGGNTGLVGGSVPVFDEVILSTSNMRTILEFEETSGTVICQAGCVLEALDQHVGDRGYRVPLDLGAKGSCQIGGNVATNAGGSRFLRYGSLRGSVLGMEVALPDGSVLDLLTTLRKDNTGYDLKQLFIGSEGTLGVITKVALACPKRSSAVNATLAACSSFAQVCNLLVRAKSDLGEILSAFEFFDGEAMELALTHLHGARDPMPDSRAKFYVLIETSGSNQEHDMAKLEDFLSRGFEDGAIEDGVLAQDQSQAELFWHLREGLPEAVAKAGTATFKYDVSLPLNSFYELVMATRQQLTGTEAIVVGWGHIGDGNLHLNVAAPTNNERIRNALEPFVYEWTSHKRGSISAEHGLGRMKAEHVHFSKSPASIALMKQIKDIFDPNGILNPYKVLPSL
mmetsp:Transcript_13227/g.26868  ORF Transcript_13227/g.26868 Transcript_13227/m.26868 type:complete len:492 (-) Transcript_13227:1587-3062(-)